jgi:AcrR family transcriptional regulator
LWSYTDHKSYMSKSHKRVRADGPARGAAQPKGELVGLGRRARRAQETRLRLFRAALQLFADRGFPNVTVEEITDAADVGKGTFFNYFESKDHVLGVMTELQLAHVAEAVQAADLGKRSIHSILHQLFLRLAQEPGRSPHLARTVVASFLASDVVRGIVQLRMVEGRAALAKIFAEGQKCGEIDSKLNSAELALQMQQVLLGTVLVWSLNGDPELPVCMESSFRLFWRGIAAPGRGQKL